MKRWLRDVSGAAAPDPVMGAATADQSMAPDIGSRMTRTYLMALAIVAASIFAGWLSLHSFLKRSDEDALIINVAGAQRMLSQRISGLSLLMQQAGGDDPALITAFDEAVARMTAGNLRLTVGADAPARATAALAAHYFGPQVNLDARVQAFLAAATRFIADPRDPAAAAAMQDARTQAFSALIVDLDAAVTMYQTDANRREAMIRKLHLAITLLALTVVVLEGLVIFRPMARRIGQQAGELTRRNAVLNSVISIIPAGIAVWRSSDGAIVTCNPVFEHFQSLTPPGTVAAPPSASDASGLLVRADASFEVELADDAAAVRSLRVTGRSFPGEGTQINVTLVEDLTDERRAAAELAQALKKAEAVNEAKSRFTASVSHEIRTPLNGLMGMLELMAQDTLAVQQAHRLHTARDSANHLMGILNDILDAASFEAGAFSLNLVPVDLRPVIENTVAMFEGRASTQHLTLDLRVDACLPDRVITDPLRLRQVVSNLIGNSLKFTETGGVTVVFAQRGDALRIEVTDTGPGISVADQARLFKRFVQLDGCPSRMQGGTGLGLSITHDIVTAMGGQIGLVSQLGQGSTFWCEVPLRICAEQGTLPETRTGAATGPRSILVVDDNKTNRLIAGQMLKTLGYTAAFAVDGEDAKAQAATGQHDLIFMDLQMPRLGGLEAARDILACPMVPRVAIFGLTAHVDGARRTDCLGAGMVGVLTKPVSIKDLKGAIDIAFPPAGCGSDGVTGGGSAPAPFSSATAPPIDPP